MRVRAVRVATLLAVLATIIALTSRAALAFPTFSDWPSRGVKIIVPFPAGSANDVAARMYAEGLSRRWTRPIVVENKPGADAIIGGGAFANANDDHVLLYGTASMITVNPLLQGALPYNPVLDLVPIAPGQARFLSSR